MSRLVSRAHQWRLTRWIQTQNRAPIWSSSTRFSGISDSKTLRKGLYEDSIKKREKARGEKHEMVKKLAPHVEILTCRSNSYGGVCDVYLIGIHQLLEESSIQKSIKEVQEIIRFLKPEVVFLELCASRQSILTTKNVKMPTEEEIISELENQANFKARFWKYAELFTMLIYILESEFRVANEEAKKYGGRVVLGDRPEETDTKQRLWRKTPLWEKINLLSSVLWSFISLLIISSEDISKLENLRNNAETLIEVMIKKFPSLWETLVHERDQFMCLTLENVANQSRSVVVVVGKKHLPGMKKHWMKPTTALKDLSTIPPPKAVISGVSLAYVLAGAATISGIYLSFKT